MYYIEFELFSLLGLTQSTCASKLLFLTNNTACTVLCYSPLFLPRFYFSYSFRRTYRQNFVKNKALKIKPTHMFTLFLSLSKLLFICSRLVKYHENLAREQFLHKFHTVFANTKPLLRAIFTVN